MSSLNPDGRRRHILVFPFPAQGHMIPLLDLSHHLAARGFPLTVVVTTTTRPLLDSFLSSVSSFSVDTLVLPLPPHPSLPSGVEQVRHLPDPNLVASLARALSLLSPHILSWAASHPNPPSLLLSDFFLGWTHLLARDLRVPRLAFYSSGALLALVLDRLFDLRPSDGQPLSAADLPSFPYHHLPSVYRRYVANAASSPDWEFLREGMILNPRSYGAVLNTFDALESRHLSHLRARHGHPRVWAVGPISPAVPAGGRGGKSSVTEAEVTRWLGACPPRSVVYVCFGSQFWPTVEQGRALAAALERSGARFVWAVGGDRAAGGERATVVPEGFDGRVSGRGLVIRGWAPQVAVLGHGAVGSFLTHCGWNSVLEGIAAGVVLLAWPMEADQFVNARLLVEEAGVAVRACEGATTVPDPEVLAGILGDSVAEGTWPEVRARAAEMGVKAGEAVGEGGSSAIDFEQMVKELAASTIAAERPASTIAAGEEDHFGPR